MSLPVSTPSLMADVKLERLGAENGIRSRVELSSIVNRAYEHLHCANDVISIAYNAAFQSLVKVVEKTSGDIIERVCAELATSRIIVIGLLKYGIWSMKAYIYPI